MATHAKLLLAVAVPALITIAGCGGKKAVQPDFRADTPFSQRVKGPGENVCWAVKRAFLTQGYMLERSADSLVMSGYKDQQTDEETNVTQRMQATCVDNKDGTSTVFATASKEVSTLQKVGYSTTTGVSIFTLSLPSGSEKRLNVQSRQTIQDPKFYQGFYALVQQFANEDIAQGRQPPPPQARQDDAPPPQARREDDRMPHHSSAPPPQR